MLALLQSLDERLVYGCFTVGWIGRGAGLGWAVRGWLGGWLGWAGLRWAAEGSGLQYACHA
jgi:hypothetical protein